MSDDSKRKHYDETGKDQAPSIETQAQAELLSLFNALLENDEVVNFLDSARQAIQSKAKSIQTNIRLGREKVRVIERKRGRVRRRDAGPNAVDMLIQQKVDRIKGAINDLTEALLVVQRAQELLEVYESTEPPADLRPDPVYRSMFFTADFLKGM